MASMENSRDSHHKARRRTTSSPRNVPKFLPMTTWRTTCDELRSLFTSGFCRVYPPDQGRQDPDRIFRAAQSQAGQYMRQEQWGLCPCLDFTLWRRDSRAFRPTTGQIVASFYNIYLTDKMTFATGTRIQGIPSIYHLRQAVALRGIHVSHITQVS